MPSSSRIYTPIMKAKRGELNAIGRLTQSTRSAISPLFDLPRPKNPSGLGVDTHIEKAATGIAAAWGHESPVYIDTSDFPLNMRCSNSEHPLERFHEKLAHGGINSIPVHAFDRDQAYLSALTKVAKAQKNGICLRLEGIDLVNSQSLMAAISQFMSSVAVAPNLVDILIDLRSIQSRPLAEMRALTIPSILAISNLAGFRSITVAASSFPKDVSAVPKDSLGLIERRELFLWKELFLAFIDRLEIRFGDYGIVHPDFIDSGPSNNKNAKIRYTIESSWLVARGHMLREAPKYAQFHDLANELISRPEYLTRHFSWGDDFLWRCAKKENGQGPGNLEQWVTADTNHHVTLVSAQVRAFMAAPTSTPAQATARV